MAFFRQNTREDDSRGAPTVAQVGALVSFLEDHKALALGRLARSREGKEISKSTWIECAKILNSLSDECHRDASGWRKYYNEYKSKVVRKVKAFTRGMDHELRGKEESYKNVLTPLQSRLYSIISSDGGMVPMIQYKYWVELKAKIKKKNRSAKEFMSSAGAGPCTEQQDLSEIDRKFLQILGDNFGSGQPGVRIQPIVVQVWADLKHRVRKKVTKIMSRLDKNGGGPALEDQLSEQERRVYSLMSSRSIVGGSVPAAGLDTYFTDFKSKLLKKVRDHKDPAAGVFLTPLQARMYKLLRGTEDTRMNPQTMDQSTSKKTENKHYKAVLKCCVELVKVHGRPVEIFDDQAFRDILEMVPLLSESHLKKLTTENIRAIIENDGKTGDDDDDDLDDTDMDRDMDTSNDQFPVKGEILVEETLECTCDALAQAEESGVVRHQASCPAAVSQPYWNFFEVSLDVAKCTICSSVITWTDITTLKEHLTEAHPTVKFVDDDAEFYKGPGAASSVGSVEDFHEVYLDDELFERPKPKGQGHGRDPISSPPRKRMKTMLPDKQPKVVDRHGAEIPLERFKSLDRFGLYVASLMKLIPKDKCMKFQVQIVERLIQEQAAAG